MEKVESSGNVWEKMYPDPFRGGDNVMVMCQTYRSASPRYMFQIIVSSHDVRQVRQHAHRLQPPPGVRRGDEESGGPEAMVW